MNSTGNTVFIPGSTSGIGLGMALRWAEAGNTVIVGGRRTDRLAEIAREHPALHTVAVDVTDPDSITAAATRVVAAHPELNVLVTMAGIMRPEDLRTPAFLPTAEALVETNVYGTIRLVAALTPHLLTRPDATIMTVSSAFGFVPWHVTPTYSGTKAFVHSYTQGLREQLRGTGVRVVELVPSGVRTDLMGQGANPAIPSVDEFLDQVFALLGAHPSADEIVVDAVRFYRDAEREGRYADAYAFNVSITA
ncbi:putative oxidoreductase [Catenuloplanes nepalensis]|uniref:Oxidoreductase n=1 Tax=Catenuloplanes nepalensis TaxID=587533 RepID=A0ABT9N7B4_9ACTN|nr:SDR family NAD(P)-dependent oxidoreductase [Catenuloplanes nepalensis]MDP9799589.1 putative oxidoreductase [Catenuloplanes nepalensis]